MEQDQLKLKLKLRQKQLADEQSKEKQYSPEIEQTLANPTPLPGQPTPSKFSNSTLANPDNDILSKFASYAGGAGDGSSVGIQPILGGLSNAAMASAGIQFTDPNDIKTGHLVSASGIGDRLNQMVDAYRNGRDATKQNLSDELARNPKIFLAGQVSGSLLGPNPVSKGNLARSLVQGGAYGLANGLTRSNADFTKGELPDATNLAVDTAGGIGGAALGYGANKLGDKLLGIASRRVDNARKAAVETAQSSGPGVDLLETKLEQAVSNIGDRANQHPLVKESREMIQNARQRLYDEKETKNVGGALDKLGYNVDGSLKTPSPDWKPLGSAVIKSVPGLPLAVEIGKQAFNQKNVSRALEGAGGLLTKASEDSSPEYANSWNSVADLMNDKTSEGVNTAVKNMTKMGYPPLYRSPAVNAAARMLELPPDSFSGADLITRSTSNGVKDLYDRKVDWDRFLSRDGGIDDKEKPDGGM